MLVTARPRCGLRPSRASLSTWIRIERSSSRPPACAGRLSRW
jgi:hypothetical protein